LVLGIGIGHPEATSEYKQPLAKMREFFDGLDAADPPVPRDERLAAALGPRMLDLAGGGSDRLIDALIPHGSAEPVAAAVQAHLDAGADHVCLEPVGHGPAPLDDYRALAKVLL
jgi:hypothetical protein